MSLTIQLLSTSKTNVASTYWTLTRRLARGYHEGFAVRPQGTIQSTCNTFNSLTGLCKGTGNFLSQSNLRAVTLPFKPFGRRDTKCFQHWDLPWQVCLGCTRSPQTQQKLKEKKSKISFSEFWLQKYPQNPFQIISRVSSQALFLCPNNTG